VDKLRFLASKNVPRSKCAEFESISSIHSFIHYTTKVRKYLGFAIVSGWMKMNDSSLLLLRRWASLLADWKGRLLNRAGGNT